MWIKGTINYADNSTRVFIVNAASVISIAETFDLYDGKYSNPQTGSQIKFNDYNEKGRFTNCVNVIEKPHELVFSEDLESIAKIKSPDKEVKGWAVMDDEVMMECYICDSPNYAKRQYMSWKANDGDTKAMLESWNRIYNDHRQVVPVMINVVERIWLSKEEIP